jgi:Protein of unknown function (DUF3119)
MRENRRGSASLPPPLCIAGWIVLFFALFSFRDNVTAFTAVVPTTQSIVSKSGSLSWIQHGRSNTASSTGLHGFFSDLFSAKGESKPAATVFEPVVIEPDYRLGAFTLALGGLLDSIPYIQYSLGPLVTLLGVLFVVQTARIRFVFDETAFELKTSTVDAETGELATTGENVVVGGANRWDCSSIINYDFFPQSWVDDFPGFPVLVYFKETQTPADKWNEGPGQYANDPSKIASGQAVAGQVHFFPAVCNAKQIRSEFAKRGCKKI